MTNIEQALSNLEVDPPEGLAAGTTYSAGATDQAVLTDSPIGAVWVSWSVNGITGVSPQFASATIDDFMDVHRRLVHEASHLPNDLDEAVTAGLLDGDTIGLPIDFRGVPEFQQSVLSTCATIPPGVVHPYGWIAAEIHNPGSVRAVGTALGRNPIPLLIPCHRIVKSDGSVGNYAFGPDLKQQLLVREGAILA
jgi:O-6-methylguanine DNA methyltransferase